MSRGLTYSMSYMMGCLATTSNDIKIDICATLNYSLAYINNLVVVERERERDRTEQKCPYLLSS